MPLPRIQQLFPKPGDQEDFRVKSEDAVLEEAHSYNFNGTTSVGSKLEVFGIHRIIAAPYFAFSFEVVLHLDGQPVHVDRFDWYPDRSEFFGKTGKDVNARMTVIPLGANEGFYSWWKWQISRAQRKNLKCQGCSKIDQVTPMCGNGGCPGP